MQGSLYRSVPAYQDLAGMVQGMLSQMDPALVSFCDKIAAQGGPLHLAGDMEELNIPAAPVVQLAAVTRTSARLRNVQPDVNLAQSYEALRRPKKNADHDPGSGRDERAPVEPDSTRVGSYPALQDPPETNGPSGGPEAHSTGLPESSEVASSPQANENINDAVMTDADISKQIDSVKQHFMERTGGYGVPQLERFYARVIKGVMAIGSERREGDRRLLVLGHLLKFVEDDEIF
ncbi:hypothetical protein B296_00018030 [Ensete ventricosum]|uniref:Uncharacterized protein n=1 Tax=Ensete ventricosum TaxID=4639 RepID=A0A426YEW1_ENSVE|nr:hypothetical protein B296_00018030 [Ensete ventricosum]